MLTLRDIHDQVEACNVRLEELVDEITAAGGDAAVCEASFKAKFAKARLAERARADVSGFKITVDAVEDRATVDTEDERLAYLLAANNLTTLREALRATQARMDGLRTMAASFRGAGG